MVVLGRPKEGHIRCSYRGHVQIPGVRMCVDLDMWVWMTPNGTLI